MRSIVQTLYDRLLRERLPRKLAVCNGVTARAARLLDATDVIPDYEAALVDGIRTCVRRGDEVVVVGGGYGVSSVVAARRAGPDGSVTTYEGAAEHVDLVAETCSLNGVADRVTVEHAAVGSDPNLYTDAGSARPVRPVDLRACDVLVLDCEGAETEILADVRPLPRSVVVETHGQFDAPPATVRAALTDRGLTVDSETTMDATLGMSVFVARNRDGDGGSSADTG
jgi:hypothetical protein